MSDAKGTHERRCVDDAISYQEAENITELGGENID